MAPVYVRLLIALGVAVGLAYGAIEGVWSIAIFFILTGTYIEITAIRDLMAEKKYIETVTSLSKLGFTSPPIEKKKE